MLNRYSAPADTALSAQAASFPRSWVGAAIVFHLALWTAGPALVLGNLHSDTLEAAYWARDFALGYSKHPPVTSWIIDLALRVGHAAPILSLMAVSQLTVAVTAFFIWRLVRLYASADTAAMAVMLYLVSPAATFYAVQINHNSVLVPFWAATLYFGFLYLEHRRWRDAIALGFITGLAILTKYEISFILVCLFALAVFVPRFRPAVRHPATYVAVFIALVLITPHVIWLQNNDWPSISRALGTDKVVDVDTLNDSAENAILGQFTLFIIPAILLLSTFAIRTQDRAAVNMPCRLLIAAVLAFGPSLVLLLGGVATYQIIKPLWVLPLTASTAVGLALLFPAGENERGLRQSVTAVMTVSLSATVFVCFLGYLFIVDAIGKPLTAYSADTKKLSAAIIEFWKSRQQAPLQCLAIADLKLTASPVLWLSDRPKFVDYSGSNWAKPEQIAECRKTGGVALVTSDQSFLKDYPNACTATPTTFGVPTAFWISGFTWPVDMIYIPPEGQGCGSAPPVSR